MFSVFPQGNSLLRMLAVPNREKEGKEVKQDSSNDALAMFEAADEGFDISIGKAWYTVKPQVPLITDCFGLQPLDYAFGNCGYVSKIPSYRDRFT